MLIEFTVGNYRSFKEKVTFSMVAANIVSKDESLDQNNVAVVDDKLKLLKSAAIYGANASGKSNLAHALAFMRWFIVNSSKETQSTDKINVENFKLSTETEEAPSFFEIIFILNKKRFRYGFEVTKNKVVSEWLFYVPKNRETKLFDRENDIIKFSKVYEADGVSRLTRHNALFLSVSAQFNVRLALELLDWITYNLKIISGLNDSGYKEYTIYCLDEKIYDKEILELIYKLDLGINGVKLQNLLLPRFNLPDEQPEGPERPRIIADESDRRVSFIQTKHKMFNSENEYVSDVLFNLESQESEGTQKVFALAAPLVETLKYGNVLVIDEFDARLHPSISCAIVKLFNSNESNPNNAQLIFMTHDTNLLSNKLFRRDQIWFTEKDRYGATDLYSLVEYKGVRSDASYESDYIKGRYGAIPFIGNLSSIFETHG
uniref:ATPase AAA-type core domain-containing protein n=1 Tax=Cyanothece sp. (strain PCC 7425 / ATCC 29141) TaxID=395961 RepID=B8HV57_CYAP4